MHVLGHQPREHDVPKCAGRRPLGLAASQTAASPTSLPHIPRLPRPASFLRFDVTAVSRPLSSIDGSRARLLWGQRGRTTWALGVGGGCCSAGPFCLCRRQMWMWASKDCQGQGRSHLNPPRRAGEEKNCFQ